MWDTAETKKGLCLGYNEYTLGIMFQEPWLMSFQMGFTHVYSLFVGVSSKNYGPIRLNWDSILSFFRISTVSVAQKRGNVSSIQDG